MPRSSNIAHGKDVDAGFLHDFAFLGVEIAGADDDDVAQARLLGLKPRRSTSSGAP